VTGDGIVEPSILASHSFGELPIVNNRIVNTQSVTFTIQDTSGQGGTYNLSTANNRYFDRDGITASVSPSTVTVPAGGSTTFTATVTLDGNKVRDTSSPLELQWYVVAKRAGSSETLRAPMYLKANPTEPTDQIAASKTDTYTGTVLASDAGVQRDVAGAYVAGGITYTDVPVEVGAATTKLDGTLDFDMVVDGTAPDLDLLLFDPSGNEIASSTNGGGPEHVSAPVSQAGTYIYRVYGWAGAATNYTLTSTQALAGAPPVVQPFASDFTDAQGRRIDFDGNYTLNWQAQNGVLQYEVEESTDGTNYAVIRDVDANTTSIAFQDVPNGTRSYRVRSILPGRIGYYVTVPSDAQSITIDHRGKVDITGTTASAISNVSLVNGVFKLDVDLTNNSTSTYVPLVEFNVVKVTSTSGTVSVTNADNGGNGASATTAALFGYSNLLGTDQQFTPAEKSGKRTLQFNDPANEMFSFDAVVTAYQNGTLGVGTGTSSASGTSQSGSSSSSTNLLSLPTVPKLMRFTVNPLTKAVTVKLL